MTGRRAGAMLVVLLGVLQLMGQGLEHPLKGCARDACGGLDADGVAGGVVVRGSFALFGLMVLCMAAAFWPGLLGWEGPVVNFLPYAALVLLAAVLVVNVLRLRALRRARSRRR